MKCSFDWPLQQDIRGVAPVPGTAKVVFLHLYKPPAHAMIAPDSSFDGVSVFDTDRMVPSAAYQVRKWTLGKKRYRRETNAWPQALAVKPDGTVVLADAPPGR